MKKWYQVTYVFITLLLFVATILFITSLKQSKKIPLIPILSPTPTPFIFTTYTAPIIPIKQSYKIVMVGDSMTASLGPHGGLLSDYMNLLYKSKPQDPQRIIIDNYAKSSNILHVNEELTWKTTINEYTFGPLLSDNFDLILVESFGYNPLSQFGIEKGLQEQNKALDSLMQTLIITHPHAAIVFVATIAPNIANYAKATQPNNSPEERATQAQERILYLKNHITYAKSHTIPLVNIYQDSLTTNGDGNMLYINSSDDIHPSFAGVTFIGHEIGNFIYDNKILIK